MQVPHTYTAPAPHSLSIPIVNKGDLLSEVALGAFMVCSAHLSAVTAEWSEGNWAPCWPWACVWAHLGHGAIPFCRACCSPCDAPSWLCQGSGKQTSRGVLIRAMLHIEVGNKLGKSDAMSQNLAVRSVSSALVRTSVNFCHADWQGFGSSLPGSRWFCPEQNWKADTSLFLVVSRWAKNSFRVNRRQWQLVISGPPSWCDSY